MGRHSSRHRLWTDGTVRQFRSRVRWPGPETLSRRRACRRNARRGERFPEGWAEEQALGDARLRVETGDVEAAIERAATDSTMVILGATERGLLSRLLPGSLVMNVVDDIDCSVLLAERPRPRGILDRPTGD